MEVLLTHAQENELFYNGFCHPPKIRQNTIRALFGHYSGTIRGLFGHYSGTIRELFGHYSGTHFRHYSGSIRAIGLRKVMAISMAAAVGVIAKATATAADHVLAVGVILADALRIWQHPGR